MKKTDNSYWISIADLMTGLMVIFLFIAINYVLQAFKYRYVQDEIYNTLQNEFREELKQDEIELKPNGTVRFNTKGEGVLFKVGDYSLTPKMKGLLDWFIPQYIEIITQPKYLKYIKEIRIEGHTDIIPPRSGEDSYIYNLRLSSNRAMQVLQYIRDSVPYKTLPDSVRARFDFLVTATGMSYSRALNKDGEYVFKSDNKIISNKKSRRVEFRVVTSSDALINDIFEMNSQ